MKKKKIIMYSTLLLVVLAFGYWFLKKEKTSKVVTYNTAEVKTGSVVNTVTATGTVQPVKKVDVGTQVSGVIKKIYVDFNSVVTKGQLLAELDKIPLLEQQASNQADLQSAQSQLTYQEANYDRIKQLYDKKAVSETDYETALYQFTTAKANVAKMKSAVDRAQTNLDYSMIYSPISGVVLNRAVDEGQTVAASFNTKMQVVANVDEADIGQVKNGQKVIFTVDAFPDESFKGTITQIRLQPVTNANVVTYSVVIDAPNPELKLKPGLTASITASTREADSVLVIPVKALRFKPDSAVLAHFKLTHGGGNRQVVTPRTTGANAIHKTFNKQVNENTDPEFRKTVWVKTGDSIEPRFVTLGLSDETNVEIRDGLIEGEQVIVSADQTRLTSVKTDNAATSSPFMPKRPKR